jgi:hypothetical protein
MAIIVENFLIDASPKGVCAGSTATPETASTASRPRCKWQVEAGSHKEVCKRVFSGMTGRMTASNYSDGAREAPGPNGKGLSARRSLEEGSRLRMPTGETT